MIKNKKKNYKSTDFGYGDVKCAIFCCVRKSEYFDKCFVVSYTPSLKDYLNNKYDTLKKVHDLFKEQNLISIDVKKPYNEIMKKLSCSVAFTYYEDLGWV